MYWLESCISADRNHSTNGASNITKLVQRLSFHRPTASYLLGYSTTDTKDNAPFRSKRFQYIAKVLAVGNTPEELLDDIRTTNLACAHWRICYDTFEPMQPKVSSTMLMCAVGRILPGEPILQYDVLSLDDSPIVEYVIVETSKKLYFVERSVESHDNQKATYDMSITHFRKMWPHRPFQYSGAINLDLAIVITDILTDLLHSQNTSDKKIRLLDPTCGSGTFLALAATYWLELGQTIEMIGVDSNPKCARGTVANLMKTFSIENDSLSFDDTIKEWMITFPIKDQSIQSMATILAADSTQLLKKSMKPFDCAVMNLPWNRNTFEFKGANHVKEFANDATTNTQIMESVATVLKTKAPIVVISADSNDNDSGNQTLFDAETCLNDLGFTILGCVSVPPKGFDLPMSNKKSNHVSIKKLKGSSHCSILIALAP